MGCSTSRSSPPFHFSTTTLKHHNHPPSNSTNSSPHHFCSPFSDYCHNSSSSSSSSSSQTTPVSRTMSMPTPLIHHPPLHTGDSNHFVSLTSTTYGSIIITTTTDTTKTFQDHPLSSPDSVINTWELMEGLDDQEFDDIIVEHDSINPCSYNGKQISCVYQSADYSENKQTYPVNVAHSKAVTAVEPSEIKPLWKHLFEEALLSKKESNLFSSYNTQLSSSQLDQHEPKLSSEQDSKGVCCCLSGCEDRIVLYYTTLRGIRKTFEDCCETRLILKGFRVWIDERDVSMDSNYLKEVQSVFKGRGFTLPQVFIRGEHIGGADEIKRLNEEGKLGTFMKGFPVIVPGFVCDQCVDVRFVPCPNCCGSRKVFVEDEGRSIRCDRCNENGLIRCVTCCS